MANVFFRQHLIRFVFITATIFSFDAYGGVSAVVSKTDQINRMNFKSFKLGAFELKLPHDYEILPMMRVNGFRGENRSSTTMIVRKTDGQIIYNLKLAEDTWSESLQLIGLKSNRKDCRSKSGFIFCSKNLDQKNLVMAFHKNEILSVFQNSAAKGLTRLPASEHIHLNGQ